MSKKLIGAVSALLLAAGVLVGCAAGGGSNVKQTAAITYEVDGTRVIVSVDVSDGYSAEFTSGGVVYLYKGENSADNKACAYGYLTSKEEYETIIAENQGKEGFEEVGAGVIYNADGVSDNFAFYVGEEQYYMIAVESDSGVDADSVFNRFDVHIEQF